MAAGTKAFWIIALCFLLAGCNSSYHAFPIPETDPDTAMDDSESPEPGDEIRLTMRDGRIFKGDFVGFEEQSVILRGAHLENSAADTYSEIEIAVPEGEGVDIRFPLSEVGMLEQYDSNIAGELAIGAAFAVVLYSLVYATQHTLDDFNLDLEQ